MTTVQPVTLTNSASNSSPA